MKTASLRKSRYSFPAYSCRMPASRGSSPAMGPDRAGMSVRTSATRTTISIPMADPHPPHLVAARSERWCSPSRGL